MTGLKRNAVGHEHNIVELRPGKSQNFREYETPEQRKNRLMEQATFLREIAGYIEQDELERDPHIVFLALIDSEGPYLAWKGIMRWDDLTEVQLQIGDYIYEHRYKGLRKAIGSVERRRQRKREDERTEQLYIEQHPWVCDAKNCHRRFKTEQGAKCHEKSCRWLAAERKVNEEEAPCKVT